MDAMQALSTPIALNTKSTSKPLVATDWHALDADSVTSLLNVDAVVGLTSSQVTQRQLRYGPNALQRIQSRPAWRVLTDQFANIVIALLGSRGRRVTTPKQSQSWSFSFSTQPVVLRLNGKPVAHSMHCGDSHARSRACGVMRSKQR